MCNYFLDPEISTSRRLFPSFAAAIVIAIAAITLLSEIITLATIKFEYFADWINWIQISLYPLAIIFVSMPNWSCPCVFDWQWQVGVVAVLLAWFDFIVFTAHIPVIGIYVLVLIEICRTFLKLLILTFLLLIAFGIAFYMIFSDPLVQVWFKQCA